jgi:hypothetical protein
MVGILDNNKNVIILGLLVVMLLPMCLGDAFIYDSIGNRIDLNYADYNFVSIGSNLPNTNGSTVSDFRFAVFSSIWPSSEWSTFRNLYAKIRSENYYGNATAILRYACSPQNISTNITIADFSNTWTTQGFAWIVLPYNFIPLGTQTIGNTTINTTSGFYMSKCDFNVLNDNATIQIYHTPLITINNRDFPSPNLNLANFIGAKTIDVNGTTHITGTRGIINAGFDILDLMLIITSMFIFIFFMIFTYIAFEYFISLLKVKEENE